MSNVAYAAVALFALGIAAGGAEAQDRTAREQVAPPAGFGAELNAAEPDGPELRLEPEVMLADLQVEPAGRFDAGAWTPAEEKATGADPLPSGPTPSVGAGATPGFGQPALVEGLGTPEPLLDLVDVADEVTFFTPRIAGAQLGLRYQSERCGGLSCRRDPLRFQHAYELGEEAEVVELGLSYTARLSTLDLSLYGAYGRADLPGGETIGWEQDLDHWDMGLSLGYGAWLVGARYRRGEEGFAMGAVPRRDFAVGLHFQPGDWRWGVQYLASEAENAVGPGTESADAFEIGGAYDAGPGVLITGGVQYWQLEDPLALDQAEGDALIFLLGTAITF